MSSRGGQIKFVCHNYTVEYYATISTILHKNAFNKEMQSLYIANKLALFKDCVNDLKQQLCSWMAYNKSLYKNLHLWNLLCKMTSYSNFQFLFL